MTVTIAVPPYEISGKGMPTTGSRPMTIPTLIPTGATVVETVCHAFPKTGLTCVLILQESHAVLHTWPETGTINIDIFSCTPKLRSVDAITELGRSFGAQAVSIQEIARAAGHGERRYAGG